MMFPAKVKSFLCNGWMKLKQDATEVYIIGDIFDFWHEYTTVIPKGFVRLQGN